MSLPAVAIGALGGTIAMTSTDGSGVVPTLSAAALAGAVPDLADVAQVRVETLAMVPSGSLDEVMVLSALRWARDAVAAGAAGVVLTQGTDTLEESAYLLDLFWDLPEPLVVTGAMRSPQVPGADGPANLLAAVRCATASDSRDRGVLVVLADEIHVARRVAKADSMSTGAFRSPVFGPVGRCVEAGVAYADLPGRLAPALPLPVLDPTRGPRVPLLTTYLGDRGDLLELVRTSGVDGVVIAGFGAGHVSAAMAEVVGRVAGEVPVLLASRTGAGPIARTTYAYPGSEVDLLARGALGTGWLAPVKARLLLWALTLDGPVSSTRLASELALRGRSGGRAGAVGL